MTLLTPFLAGDLPDAVAKVDDSLGLVFGWAIVCKVDGEDYYDLGELQDDGSRIRDHIPESTMLKAAASFMANSRQACDMHKRDEDGKVVADGTVVFCFPYTTEIAKALGVAKPKKTGLLVAVKPDSEKVLKEFRDGTRRGFSIGGFRIKDEEVAT